MTLKELGEVTNLSASFLSQVERGSTSIAITSLKKIADAFNVSMSYFFNETDNHNYAVKVKEQKQFKVEGSDSTYVRLAGKFPDRKLEPMVVTLEPKQQSNQIFSHPGEEFYYVLKGTVLFRVENHEYILSEGDAIHFPSMQVHEWENPTEYETVLLSVLTPVIF